MARSLVVFLDADLPSRVSPVEQARCGFSIYCNTLIRWDEDRDRRVIQLLSQMPGDILGQLQVVQESEGSVSFVWGGNPPKGYEQGESVNVDGDEWYISISIRATGTSQPI